VGVLPLFCVPALAQLNLPLQTPRLPSLPSLPGVGASAPLGSALDAAQSAAGALSSARRTAVQTLIRRHSRELEADPNGEPAVRSQVVAANLPSTALERITAAGYGVVSRQTITDPDLEVIVLAVPRRTSTRRALEQLRRLAPGVAFDYNHLYLGGGEVGSSTVAPTETAPTPTPGIAPGLRVGLIDAGVDTAHLVFSGASLRSYGCTDHPVPSAHGTAVASLLIGHAADFDSAAAGGTLYAADVYCGAVTGGSIDAIARAFAWLRANRVAVINVSLVGAGNLILQQLVTGLAVHGFLIVAAVGNDGPAAPPLYPAAYPGVVGVTAVDAHRRVLVEAARGPQVMFAAPGADMAAAGTPQGFVAVRGTSFASPIVAALLAQRLADPDPAAAQAALDGLAREAVDLGPKGGATVYGRGVVGEAWRMSLDITQHKRLRD
jgi:subtilisin family serine protease